MLENGDIQHAYVLCGSHETELRTQAIEDTKAANPSAFAKGEIQVFFRQDFASATMDITNSLIVVDESHLDQSKGQQLEQFLSRYSLSMDGNPEVLKAKNAYIVSVDATPYSELAAMAHSETPYEKHIEELIPGEGYIGLSEYLYLGLMKSTFDISKDPHRFISQFRKGIKSYALLRLSASYKGRVNPQEMAVKELCKHFGIRVVYFTAEDSQVSIEDLAKAPEVNTVIIVRGRLRAGKVVPKEHISFVWEGAKISNTDALVQGLPGRMCGYNEGMALPTLFVPPSALERKEKKVIKASEIERAILTPDLLPTKATNIKKPHVANKAENGKTQCPTIKMTLDRDDYEYLMMAAKTDAHRAENCQGIFVRKLDLIRKNPLLTPEQKAEILDFAQTARPHVRNLKGDSQLTYFKELHAAFENGTSPAEHIADCPQMTFFVLYDGYEGLNIPGVSKLNVYVVLYTQASSGTLKIKTAHLLSRIPKTNGKSIFGLSDSKTAVPLVAGGVSGLSEESLKSPENLEKGLRNYLNHWKTSELVVAREIQSASERFRLAKKAFNYVKGSKNNDVQAICARLSAEYGIKMNIKYGRSSSDVNGHFNIKSISW